MVNSRVQDSLFESDHFIAEDCAAAGRQLAGVAMMQQKNKCRPAPHLAENREPMPHHLKTIKGKGERELLFETERTSSSQLTHDVSRIYLLLSSSSNIIYTCLNWAANHCISIDEYSTKCGPSSTADHIISICGGL